MKAALKSLMELILAIVFSFIFIGTVMEVSTINSRLDKLEAAPDRTHTCQLVDGKNRYTCRYIEIEEVR